MNGFYIKLILILCCRLRSVTNSGHQLSARAVLKKYDLNQNNKLNLIGLLLHTKKGNALVFQKQLYFIVHI